MTTLLRKHGTLSANVAVDVTLNVGVGGARYRNCEVMSHGVAGDIYARSDGTAATVKGDDCYVATPYFDADVPLPAPDSLGNIVISIISSAAVDYSVMIDPLDRD